MELYKIVGLLLSLAVVIAPPPESPIRRDLMVAAAASLSVVAPELTQALHEATGIEVRFNFAGSNTLARQIVEGARVDVFISADQAQMDAVERAGRVVPGSRADVVSNQLVVIANRPPNAPPIRVDDLGSPAVRRIAMGDPAAVPAGVYGRKWLETLRVWAAVAPKIVPLTSSPAVVAAINAGRADVGIVYLSDVVKRDNTSAIRIELRVTGREAPPIMYPAAAITGGRIAVAQEFIAFLRGPRAQAIFESAGFLPITAR